MNIATHVQKLLLAALRFSGLRVADLPFMALRRFLGQVFHERDANGVFAIFNLSREDRHKLQESNFQLLDRRFGRKRPPAGVFVFKNLVTKRIILVDHNGKAFLPDGQPTSNAAACAYLCWNEKTDHDWFVPVNLHVLKIIGEALQLSYDFVQKLPREHLPPDPIADFPRKLNRGCRYYAAIDFSRKMTSAEVEELTEARPPE